MLLSFLFGCPREPTTPPEPLPEPSPPGETASTGDTGVPAPAPGCSLGTNALRMHCVVTLDEAGPVTVQLVGPPGVPTRTFVDAAEVRGHDVLAWGLVANTPYAWTITDREGEVALAGVTSTDTLPIEVLELGLELEAKDPGAVDLEAVLFHTNCPEAHAVMVDAEGRVVWYTDLRAAVQGARVNGVSWTERQTIGVLYSNTVIGELDLDGNGLWRAEKEVDFEDYVHHDLHGTADGLTYTLSSRPEDIDGVRIMVDGVLVFGPDGALVDSFDTERLYPYSPIEPWMFVSYWAFFPGAADFTHANSVFVDDAGDVWVSFRHLHAFAKFRGGPGSDGFGELLLTVVGNETSPIASLSDVTLVGEDPTFSGQHDVHVVGDEIWMLDNGWLADQDARGVRFALDEEAGTFTELGSWSTGQLCPSQGSARELPTEDVVIACPAQGTAREYAPGATNPDWELTAVCAGTLPMGIVRAIPIDLP